MSGQRSMHADDEAWVAEEMARELDALAGRSHVAQPAGFADRVMSSIANEPLPQPARAFGAAVAARRVRAALSSVGDAWRVATGGPAPMAVRAQAFTLVLVVAAGSLAVAGGATVGAIDLMNMTQPSQPSPLTPLPSEPSPSPSPSLTPSPSPSLTPSPSPSSTHDHGGGSGGGDGTTRPTGTDVHAGGDG